MFIPRAVGEPRGINEIGFGLPQRGVQPAEVTCGRLFTGLHSSRRLVEALGGGFRRAKIERETVALSFASCGVNIGEDLASVGDVIVGEYISIRHAYGLESQDSGHFLQIEKMGIGFAGKPCEVVECGMVNTVWALGADVGRWHTDVLQERRVVRSRAEVADLHGSSRLPGNVDAGTFQRMGVSHDPSIVDRTTFGTGDSTRDAEDELFERRDGRSRKIRPGNTDIDVEV